MGLTIVRFIFYGLAGLAAIAAVIFIIRALVARSLSLKKVYGVARQNERQRMMLYAYYSVGLFILGLIFVGIGSLTLLSRSDTEDVIESTSTIAAPVENVEAATATATSSAIVEPTIQNTAIATPLPVTGEESPTVEVPVATGEPTQADASPTAEPAAGSLTPTVAAEVASPQEQTTATVNSPIVGLYLRSVPSGEILERLEDQAIVTVLDEQQTVDNIDWVKVVSGNGNEGWVAAEFLVFPNP